MFYMYSYTKRHIFQGCHVLYLASQDGSLSESKGLERGFSNTAGFNITSDILNNSEVFKSQQLR